MSCVETRAFYRKCLMVTKKKRRGKKLKVLYCVLFVVGCEDTVWKIIKLIRSIFFHSVYTGIYIYLPYRYRLPRAYNIKFNQKPFVFTIFNLAYSNETIGKEGGGGGGAKMRLRLSHMRRQYF